MPDGEVAAIQQDARDQFGIDLTPEDIDPARAAIRDAKKQLGLEIRPSDIREES